MNQLNCILLEGTVLKFDELKITPDGLSWMNFEIANSRIKDDLTENSIFSVRVFGKPAAICAEECKPGRAVSIIGRLKNYTTNKESNTWVIAERIEWKP